MKLSASECQLFFNIYYPLLFYTNQQRRIIPNIFTVDGLKRAHSAQLKVIRNIMHQQINLIDQFILKNPVHLSSDELEIVASWKRSFIGRFFIFRETNYHTIFLSNIKPIKAYGVVALNKEFEEIFNEPLPIYIETVLIPFNDKIITDGIFSHFRLKFGSGFTRNLHKSYQKAIDNEGIITCLS